MDSMWYYIDGIELMYALFSLYAYSPYLSIFDTVKCKSSPLFSEWDVVSVVVFRRRRSAEPPRKRRETSPTRSSWNVFARCHRSVATWSHVVWKEKRNARKRNSWSPPSPLFIPPSLSPSLVPLNVKVLTGTRPQRELATLCCSSLNQPQVSPLSLN